MATSIPVKNCRKRWGRKENHHALSFSHCRGQFLQPCWGGRNFYIKSIQTCEYYVSLDIPASKWKLILLTKVSGELSETKEWAETQGPAQLSSRIMGRLHHCIDSKGAVGNKDKIREFTSYWSFYSTYKLCDWLSHLLTLDFLVSNFKSKLTLYLIRIMINKVM